MNWNNVCDDNEMADFEDIGDENVAFDEEASCSSSSVSKPTRKRGRQTFMTARLASALDFAKLSDGMTVHILTAAAEALGHRVEDLVLNKSSVHRWRQQNRLKESAEIATAFVDSVILFIH